MKFLKPQGHSEKKTNKKLKQPRWRKAPLMDSVLQMPGLFLSRLLGEGTYAKRMIYSERLTLANQVYFRARLRDGLDLLTLKQKPASQLGYLAAIKDLDVMSINKLYYLTAWASGKENPVIVNQAVGKNYSSYLMQSTNQRDYIRGYQTAIIHFVTPLVEPNGIIDQINAKLTANASNDLKIINPLFMQISKLLSGTNPFNKLTENEWQALSSKTQTDVSGALLKLITDGYWERSKTLNHSQSLSKYRYQGEDFTESIDERQLKAPDLSQKSLTIIINRLVNTQLVELLNITTYWGIYTFVYKYLKSLNFNLLGISSCVATDYEVVVQDISSHFAELQDRLGLPKDYSDLIKKIRSLDLGASKGSRNDSDINYQVKYSYLHDQDNHLLRDEYDNSILGKYGVLNTVYEQLLKMLVIPTLATYIVKRNQLMALAISGEEVKMRGLEPTLIQPTTSYEEVVTNMAYFQCDQVIKLIRRGNYDYAKGIHARNQTEFNKLMRESHSLKPINYRYQRLSKNTKQVLFWFYQSSFRSKLTAEEKVNL